MPPVSILSQDFWFKKALFTEKASDDDGEDKDMADLEKSAASNPNRWDGEEVIKVEFKQTGVMGWL